VLQKQWQFKHYMSKGSGTNQKTEDFELSTGSSQGKRENWVLGCGELIFPNDT
jgi:hypothetical protein